MGDRRSSTYSAQDSSVIVSYPWTSDVIVIQKDLPNFFGEGHDLKNLLVALQDFESNVLGSNLLDGFELRKALHIPERWPKTHLVPAVVKDGRRITPSIAGKCLIYICANRFVDIKAWLDGLPQTLCVPSHRRREFMGKTGFKYWDKLRDWPSLLSNCHVLFQKEDRPLAAIRPNTTAPCLSLLSSIVRRIEKTDAMKISSNIEIAALHLSVMLKGLLDFPTTIDWFLEQEKAGHTDLKAIEFLQQIYQRKGSLHKFKLPLHLSLIFSPLLLLLPIQLHKLDWDRLNLLQTGKALGNLKPDSIRQVERVMWPQIISIANGRSTFEESMANILSQLSLEFLASITSDDLTWFPLPPTEDSCVADESFELHEADLEGNLPIGWPDICLAGSSAGTTSIQSPVSIEQEQIEEQIGTDESNRIFTSTPSAASITGENVPSFTPSHPPTGSPTPFISDGGDQNPTSGPSVDLPKDPVEDVAMITSAPPPPPPPPPSHTDRSNQIVTNTPAAASITGEAVSPPTPSHPPTGLPTPFVSDGGDQNPTSGPSVDLPKDPVEDVAMITSAPPPPPPPPPSHTDRSNQIVTNTPAAASLTGEAVSPPTPSHPPTGLPTPFVSDGGDQNPTSGPSVDLPKDPVEDVVMITSTPPPPSHTDLLKGGQSAAHNGSPQRILVGQDNMASQEDIPKDSQISPSQTSSQRESSLEQEDGNTAPHDVILKGLHISEKNSLQDLDDGSAGPQEDIIEDLHSALPRRSPRKTTAAPPRYSNADVPSGRKKKKCGTTAGASSDRLSCLQAPLSSISMGSSDREIVSPEVHSKGSSPDRPIDITVISSQLQRRSVTLNLVRWTKSSTRCPEALLYDPYCNEISVNMKFHSKEKAKQFSDLVADVNRLFVQAVPLHHPSHVAKKPKSSISKGLQQKKTSLHIVSQNAWTSRGQDQMQATLTHRHLVLINIPFEPMAFDEHGLETLKSIDTVIDIFDFSQDVDVPDEKCRRQGTLSQMLESASSGDSKILATPDIPLEFSGINPSVFSTDFYAWHKTEGDSFCGEETSYPINSMRWGSASIKGALFRWKIAPNGFGLYIDVKVGSMWVVFGRDKKGNDRGCNRLSTIGLYGEKFNPYSSNVDLWDLEAIVLKPGMRLILRPNTPYRCLSLENTICHGGRFYSTHMLQDTAIGLFHGFISNDLTGGVSYSSASRKLLQRMIFFYHRNLIGTPNSLKQSSVAFHLPDFLQTRSTFNFLTLIVLVILLNVLDPQTYEYPDVTIKGHDQNSLSLEERLACMYARGKADQLLTWFSANYEVIDSSQESHDVFAQIVLPRLSYLQETLLKYKATISIVTSCTFDRFKDQLEGALDHYDGIESSHAQVINEQNLADSLGWNFSKLRVQRKSLTSTTKILPEAVDFVHVGSNLSDMVYKKFRNIPDQFMVETTEILDRPFMNKRPLPSSMTTAFRLEPTAKRRKVAPSL